MSFMAIGECMIELSGGAEAMYRQGFAGDTFNTAWYARRALPAEIPVSYFTAIGTDTMSDRMLEFLSSAGIATDAVLRVPDRRPGLYMIEQKDGDRHFTYWRDRSAARLMAEDPAALAAAFAGQAMLYFSGITLAILAPEGRTRLKDALQASGARLAFDPNIRPILWENDEVMRREIGAAAAISHIVLPSFDDEARHFGDADPAATAARYAALGAREVVVKNGGAPVQLQLDGESFDVPVPPAERVVDATGAGDSFNGAYLASRLVGDGAREAALEGIATSARVIARHGAIVPAAVP